jgi:hypothetical protein
MLLVPPNVLGNHLPETSATTQQKFLKPSVVMKTFTISLSGRVNRLLPLLDPAHFPSGSGRDVNIIIPNFLKEERSVIFEECLWDYWTSSEWPKSNENVPRFFHVHEIIEL